MHKLLKPLPSNLDAFSLTPKEIWDKALKLDERRISVEKCYEAMVEMISNEPDKIENDQALMQEEATKKARIFRHFVK